MRFRILGPLEIEADGVRIEIASFKQRSVLALLLVHANQIVSTDRLIDELWGDEGSKDKQNALWVHVSNLRKVLEPGREKGTEAEVLITKAPGYLLRVDEEQVDAGRFAQLVAEGRALRATDPAAASLVLTEALSMWRGHALEDFTYESWAQPDIARLDELRLEAVETRIDADLAWGMARELVGELEGLVRQYPLRERMAGQMMLALYRSGRQAEALRAYQTTRSRLSEELGIEPSAGLRSLEEMIVMNDPSLDLGTEISLFGQEARSGLSLRGYELRDVIGEGAYGLVYRAYQPAVGREVAVKVIRPELANDPRFVRSFEAEAQTVASLEHPHILPLYDYWREPDAAYLVTRLMRGGSLADRLGNGDVDPYAVAEQVGGALATAHRHGVVHRDLKPSNVFLDDDGNAFLGDFGIAAGGDEGSATDPVVETLSERYAPPEQLEGGASTPASDVYSLATLINEIGDDLDGGIGEVLARATASDPSNRYPDADVFLRALHKSMGHGTVRIVPTVDTPNPFKGLRPFEETDAADYLGRERTVDRLVARLGSPGVKGRFIAVVGPSGAGKSSVVKAGLVPALRAGALPGSKTWFVTELVPAPHPFDELADALDDVAVRRHTGLLEALMRGPEGLARAVGRVLPDDDSQLLVIIDQFEELFTQVDAETADRFLDALVHGVEDRRSRIRVVVTLRADFYDRPLTHRVFGELLRDSTEPITPMTPEELERAITGPVEPLGVAFDPGLVARMVADVADRPGALPLLQYALTELFDRRAGPTIRLGSYAEIGGVAGALVNRAEGLHTGLGPDLQETTRQLFLRLVTLGEGSEDTRRRALLTELNDLGSGDAVDAVLERYGRHRLLTFDRDPISRTPTVEIAHEALFRDWPRLGRWIDQVRDDVRVSRRLEQAAAEWHGNDRASAYLLRAGRLAQAESHLDSTSVVAGSLVREFVSTSRELVDVETEQRRRRRRRVTAGFGIAAVVSLLLAVVAFIAQQQSANSAAVARSRELALAATAPEVLSVDSELSLLLALASARTAEPSVETITALHEAIAQHRTVFRYSWPEGQDYWVVGGDLSDDGSLLVSWALFGDYLEVVSIPDGSLRWSKEFPGRSASHAFFVADGTEVAVGVSSRPGSDATEDDVGLFLLDAATGEVVHHERFGNCGAELPDTAAGVSDGRLLVFGQPGADCSRDEGGFDKYDRWSIFSFDLATSSLVKLSDEFQASSGRAAISGDGTVAAVLSARSLMELYDTTTGERLDSVGAALLQSFALDSDGSRALNGSSDGVRVIDTGSAADLALFEGHDELPWGAWFSNDGSVAFSSGGDGFVRVWDPATGEEILAVPGGGLPWLSAMTDDGSRIASFDSGGEARILDMTVDTGVEISKGTGKPNPIRASASNESRRSVRLTSEDGAVRVTTDENGQTFYVRGTGSRELAVSAGPDGPPVPRQQAAIIPGTHQVVLGFLDKIVRVDGDTMSIEATRRWSEGALPVAWLTPSPDGSFIVGTGAGFVSGRRNPESLNFLAEGSYLAGEPVVEIMDPWTLETIIRIDKAHTDTIVDLAVSSDGSLVASGSRDRFARVWSSSDGALVHAIPAPGPVHGVEFTADDRHLMVILENGDAYEYTLDPGELLDIARSRLTRGFTAAECTTYGLAPCPTLDELRDG